jgi:diguanylate cyclase (GGDEF)-like protein
VLTASNAIEYAWEGDTVFGEAQPSVFTGAIVKGLATGEAARSRQAHISIEDLYDYVRREFRRIGAKQSPQKWALGVEGELIIAKAVRRIPARGREKHLILVADDDHDLTGFAEANLRLDGFEVITADDGKDALTKAIDREPDLILLDVMMPRMDGYEVVSKLRADSRTAHIPVIMLSAKSLSADKVLGLTAGADDYIVKPFDPAELAARVKAVLRRAGEVIRLSPLTGLPGNNRIEQEIQARIKRNLPMAIARVDLNNLKSFNDRYGFLRGDEVISLAAQVLRLAAQETAGPDGFVGHIGGDDFMAIVPPEAAEVFSNRVIESFDARILSLYDPEDAGAGMIELEDRQGQLRRFPIVSISLGIASNAQRRFRDHSEVVATTVTLLGRAKRRDGSAYVLDKAKSQSRARGKTTA